MTRLNISFAVQVVCQFVSSSRHLYLSTVHRIIHYNRNSSSGDLCFPLNSSFQLKAFADVDWVGYRDTRRSTKLVYIFWGVSRILVSANSNLLFHSPPTEVSDMLWLPFVVKSYGSGSQLNDFSVYFLPLTPLYADNLSAIHIAANPMYIWEEQAYWSRLSF